MSTVTVGLIKGRHEMPVDEYIFDGISDVHDYRGIRKGIRGFIETRVGVEFKTGTGIDQSSYEDVQVFRGKRELVVYVTGLTAVTAELVAVCMANGVRLTLMHYDTISGNYIPQKFGGWIPSAY